MLSDAEIDSLSRRILLKAIDLLQQLNLSLFDLHATDEGEPALVYSATSPQGFGSFICEFFPLETAREIVKRCDLLFESCGIELTDHEGNKLKKWIKDGHSADSRAISVEKMAENATYHLLGSLRDALCACIEEQFLDSEVIAKTSLQAVIAASLDGIEGIEAAADMRAEINEAANRAFDSKQRLLQNAIHGLPKVVAKRGRGAPAKTPRQRDKERKEYLARLQDVYRDLSQQHGKLPSKTLVAKTLGEGGVNPKTGGDSRLQAFSTKLRRLGISYEEVTKTINKEVNNNS
jgi:hypothetical protein